MSQTKNVGIWIRVSTEIQVKEESPEHHEARARYYAQSKDWNVLEVYRLEAVSGKSVIGHPEAKRMLADVRNGRITGLVFSKLARLARSTKELLEFAEIFRHENADLISLSENIDTSSPAGRLFFTIISAMAEWEREEIAARVAASVPIRARMGKPLGGAAPFGYKWSGKDFLVDEKEAPIRKMMYELFLIHQRKYTTAKVLNDQGYRTRNGSLFTATSIERLLRDSTAKGERRTNYTKSLGTNKTWALKPKSEWVIIPCQPIVSEELWNQVNNILDSQAGQSSFPSRTAAYLLSGFVKCGCGKTMYVIQKSKNYSCRHCKVRIRVADIDEIFQTQLQGYLSGINMTEHLQQADAQLQEHKGLLEAAIKDRARVAKRMNDVITLHLDGGLSKNRYHEQYQPLEARLQQLDNYIPQLEAEIDVMTIHLLSRDTVLSEAKTLNDQWHEMSFEQKRAIIETILTSLVVDKENITINLTYEPTRPPPEKNLPAAMPLRLLQSSRKGMHLPAGHGTEIPGQNIRTAIRPHRLACRGNARQFLRTIIRTTSRAK